MPKSRRTNQQKPKAMIDEQQAKTASYAVEQASKLLAIQEPKNYIEKESYQCAETLDKADCLNSILQPPKNVSSEKIDPQLIQQLISKTVKHTIIDIGVSRQNGGLMTLVTDRKKCLKDCVTACQLTALKASETSIGK